jgi:hypothetical protein
MWPFSNKKKDKASAPSVSVSRALELLANAGIRTRAGISHDDLLKSLGGTMESRVDWTALLCALGDEVEHGQWESVSDDLWHLDAECIEDDGDYARLMKRFAALAKDALPITDIRDHVEVENHTAWVEFTMHGKTVHWDLEVSDDWMDPGLYSRLQECVSSPATGKKFFIVALGQDSLIGFGDESLRRTLSELSGLEFQWE